MGATQEMPMGTILKDRYLIQAVLGRGGMGAVYRAHDRLLDRNVAIKLLSKSTLGSKGTQRLLNEARAAAALNHPNIVSIYDAGEISSAEAGAGGGLTGAQLGSNESYRLAYIIMEYLPGESLYEHHPESIEQGLSIAMQVCAALDHAHSHGIVHRDLKPENIIVCGEQVKLTDFGLARSVASRLSHPETEREALVGTLYYIAPEQAMGEPVSGKADVYSLGVVIYEMFAGRLPFRSDDPLALLSQHLHAAVVPPSSYNPAISPALDSLVTRMMSKHPEERPTARETQAALAGMLRLTPPEFESGLQLSLLAQSVSPLSRLARGRLVGREREMTQARLLWRSVTSGDSEAHVLLISGEAGVGKTPLLRELVSLAEVSGGAALQAECYPEDPAPYGPVAELVEQAIERFPVSLPERNLADLVALAPGLQSRFPDLPTNPSLEPLAGQQRLYESIVALFAAITASTPLLLVVEDAHWADPAALAALRHITRRTRTPGANLPLLLTLTYREQDLDESHPLNTLLLEFNRERMAERIKLRRFDRDQTRAYLEVMLQEPVTEAFLDGVFRETEGNQYFIEEVCKALVDEGILRREGDHWVQPESMEGVDLPQSVRLAVQSRLKNLPAETQDVLRLAAIAGREFQFDVLQRASDLDEEALVTALEQGERALVIEEICCSGPETFVFDHKLTVSVLRESVSGVRRRRMQRRVASAIQSLHPEDYEVLAYHFSLAGDDEQAYAYNLKAADRARSLYANDKAICYYTDALEFLAEDDPRRFELLQSRLRVYDLVADRDAQQGDVEALLELAEKVDDDRLRCDARLAEADFYLGTRHVLAAAPAEEAARLAQSLEDRLRYGRALRRLTQVAMYKGDSPRAAETIQQAVTCFRESGSLAETAEALHILTLILSNLDDNTAAEAAAREAISLARQAGDRRQEGTSLRRLSITLLRQGRLEEGFQVLDSALKLHRELGDRAAEGMALGVLGSFYGWSGKPDLAQQSLHEAIDIARAIGSFMQVWDSDNDLLHIVFRPYGRFEDGLALFDEQLADPTLNRDEYFVELANFNKALLLSDLGQYRVALQVLQDNWSRSQRVHAGLAQGYRLVRQAILQAELGEFNAARVLLQEAEALVIQEQEFRLAQAWLMRIRAYIACLEYPAEELEEAERLADAAIPLSKGTGMQFDYADALAIAAMVKLKRGKPEAALEVSEELAMVIARWPFQWEFHQALIARALRATGRDAEARNRLGQAARRVRDIAATIKSEEYRRSWLEDVRVHREILEEATDLGV